jgi:NAD(P)-dependent dehydrogenase (short-subunit alcohol dehydrogenase family)
MKRDRTTTNCCGDDDAKVKKAKVLASDIYDKVKKFKGNNVILRNEQESCHDLDRIDQTTPLLCHERITLDKPGFMVCYGCGKHRKKNHNVYVFSCFKCGEKFQKNRHMTRDLSGHTALVTGSRTKLGHQVSLKLLRSGCKVVATSRRPEQIKEIFSKYPDHETWKGRLFPYGVDLDVNCLEQTFTDMKGWIMSNVGSTLDILVNCAAQTIKARDKPDPAAPQHPMENRYGDPKFVHSVSKNSWDMRTLDMEQTEMEEVYRINSVAPVLLVKTLHPLMEASGGKPFIINVHAREGIFQTRKRDIHLHTNMAKAALAMSTKCIARAGFKTRRGMAFSVHGCDPGWISQDEYHEDSKPWPVPPLDEVDGAARILYPLWVGGHSNGLTRRHFNKFLM